jgi:predicted metal-dependent phosphoesterase TrpH
MHSRFSVDALTKPSTIVKVCKKKGFGFSLTDHNNMGAYVGKESLLKLAKKEKVFLIPGEEIKVLDCSNPKKCAGEVVAYFLNEPIVPSTFEEILDSVKAQDALLSCPHPFDWPRKNFKDFKTYWKNFDCMEIYNARAYYAGLNKKSEEFFNEVRKKKNIAALGVSDAHTPEEIGNGLTEINATTEEEFRKEIKKGKTNVLAKEKARVWDHVQTQLARRRIIKER